MQAPSNGFQRVMSRIPLWVRVVYLIGAVPSTCLWGFVLRLGAAAAEPKAAMNWVDWLALVVMAVVGGSLWPLSLLYLFGGGCFRSH